MWNWILKLLGIRSDDDDDGPGAVPADTGTGVDGVS